MKIVFIADAHLKGLDDPNQKKFVDFLDSLCGADKLVVLGDLFDFWTGYNRVVEMNYRPALEALLRLKRRGVDIVYIEGNHDFSMGSFFTDTLKALVCPDSHILELNGKRYYLSHGDTIGMTFGYRLWRGFLRSPLFGVTARLVTPRGVWKAALYLSNRSRDRHNRGSSRYNATENSIREFAAKKLSEGVDGVITGHSHSPGVHNLKGGVYANPGSLIDGEYLVWEDGAFKVERGGGQNR
ncbi:MAG: UDP-2,3-diacylglucosamine diphosphatase [Deltaproteobacteria bacterium]|nr:UDP-2,3-diacylglucosamine diphosphatase [Deltaproteobacteria bacterium]